MVLLRHEGGQVGKAIGKFKGVASEIKNDMTFIPVKTLEEVLTVALPPPQTAT